MIIKINNESPQKNLIRFTAEVLRKDGVIAYPTDTVYGIGCRIYSRKAVERIHRIKMRQRTKPMSFICRSLKEVSKYARVSDFAFRVMKEYLPGPYTFILEASREAPKPVIAKQHTVGIRIPDSNICQDILKELGEPITSTSANLEDQPEITDIYDIKNTFHNLIELFIDGGPLISQPSTIISLVNDNFEILRQGKGIINP